MGDQVGEANTLNNIGAVYSNLGDQQKALAYLNSALPLRRAVSDKGGEAATLNNIGLVYSDLGDKQEAVTYCNSARETGLGKEVNGEGLVGLTRGLMYAGAARQVVSLWKVDDVGTFMLMQEFYKQLFCCGKSPTAALRAAQLNMWQQQKWHHPYYWWAFTFQGEWR